jgi:hypothetical protein
VVRSVGQRLTLDPAAAANVMAARGRPATLGARGTAGSARTLAAVPGSSTSAGRRRQAASGLAAIALTRPVVIDRLICVNAGAATIPAET